MIETTSQFPLKVHNGVFMLLVAVGAMPELFRNTKIFLGIQRLFSICSYLVKHLSEKEKHMKIESQRS